MGAASDTIAAIATAWGEAGIAIVRLSGASAVEAAAAVLRFKETNLKEENLEKENFETESFRKKAGFPPPRSMRLASLLDGGGRIIDEVLAVYFQAPKSYTGEDVVEIHTHGGTLVAQLCLESLLSCRGGVRTADPGEFTKRAFLNGRLDLSQSESVLGIIQSRSAEALRAAARTLSGELSSFAGGIREELLELQASLEVGLDFPEEGLPYRNDEDLLGSVSTLKLSLSDLLDRCSVGLLLREGIRVALTGRPNVGKSSLLNALLKQSRAIVTALPGTTRDVIEESITYRGVPIRLVDTAGLRAPADEIEASGIERTQAELKRSDICLWVLDGSLPLNEEEFSYIEQLRDKDHIVVLNKADLSPAVTEDMIRAISPESPVLSLSSKTGAGLDLLKDSILSFAASGGALDAGLNVTARQLSEVRDALSSIAEAEAAIAGDLGQDIAASLIAAARMCLEHLLGLHCDDALLDSIFSRFCVGK